MRRSPSLLLRRAVIVAALALGSCKRDEPVIAAPPVPPPTAQGLPGGAPPPLLAQPPEGLEIAQRIAAEKQAVVRDPKNASLWVALGNDYFDTHQPQLAIDAYASALKLRPDDPDVLTDQGVMYRELKNYKQALANFEKASKINPLHLQSLYNTGVVYASDLHDSQKAIEAFRRVIAADPMSPQAAEARAAISQLEQVQAGR